MMELELQEALEEWEENTNEIKSLTEATDIMRKMRWVQEKKEENRAVADREIQRVEKWLEKENGKWESISRWYEGLILRWYAQQRQYSPKFKLSTPYGKVATRTITQYQYDDEKIIQWAESTNNQDLIRVKREVEKGKLKNRFKPVDPDDPHSPLADVQTGEIIEGVSARKETSTKIKIGGEQ